MEYVIIYSKSVEDHISLVEKILTTLAEASVTLKMKKCTLFSDKVEYFRHVTRPVKLVVDKAQTVSLQQAKQPTTKIELRFFLRLCIVY